MTHHPSCAAQIQGECGLDEISPKLWIEPLQVGAVSWHAGSEPGLKQQLNHLSASKSPSKARQPAAGGHTCKATMWGTYVRLLMCINMMYGLLTVAATARW